MSNRGANAPIRTCVGCRATEAQASLVRLARDGSRVVLDPRRRMQGRGAYVHPRGECVERAVRRGGLARGLRCDVSSIDAATILTAVASRA